MKLKYILLYICVLYLVTSCGPLVNSQSNLLLREDSISDGWMLVPYNCVGPIIQCSSR